MRTAVISDLHLDPDNTRSAGLFFHFLKHLEGNTESLYILGDLFEKWIGDDDDCPFYRDIIQRLKALSSAGISLFILCGNRDFLLGKRFAAQTESQLLTDPAVIEFYGEKILLSHGDIFCTDDKSYQRFRRWVRKPWIQRLFLCLPLNTRQLIGNYLRKKSQDAQKDKSIMIMDTNQNAIVNTMLNHQVDFLIHGHTHRPNLHCFHVSDQYYQRIVLSDWGNKGNVLFCYPDRRKELSYFSDKPS